MAWLVHSQKGSEWKEHKYVKREGTAGKLEDDGKYYYPDSYEGGRHLPKGDGTDNKSNSGRKKEKSDSDWENKVHEHLDKIIKEHPDMFKSGTDVARHLMDEKNLGAVRNTLKAFGLDTDKMSDDEIRAYRRKIADKYDANYKPEEKKSSTKSSTKSSKKKKSEDTTEKKSEEKKDEKKKEEKKRDDHMPTNSKKPYISKAVYYGGKPGSSAKHSVNFYDKDYLEHHGILGMHWGKKNGPPYPLGAGDHSASEKKAGWRKSLDKDSPAKKPGGSSGSDSGSDSTSYNNNSKNPKDWSDEELNRRLQRLRNEKAYNDLANPKKDTNSTNSRYSSKMTDKEASDYVNRMRNDEAYKDMSSKDISKGSKFVKRMLILGGTTLAVTFVTQTAVKAGTKGADSVINKFGKKAAEDVTKNVGDAASKAAKSATSDILRGTVENIPGYKNAGSSAYNTAKKASKVVWDATYKDVTNNAYRTGRQLALPMKSEAQRRLWKNKFKHSGVNFYDKDYLEHHGILGMHWGKKNGPPYPLGASDHSASEKKAGWRKSLNGGSDNTGKSSSKKPSVSGEEQQKPNKKLSEQEASKLFKSLPKDKKFLDTVKKENGIDFSEIKDPELRELTMMEYVQNKLKLDW